MDKTLTQAGRIASAGGRSATSAVQAAHGQLEILPQAPSYANYWSFVVMVIVLLFILYTAQKGTLSTWISLMGWTAIQPLGSATAGSNPLAATGGTTPAQAAANQSQQTGAGQAGAAAGNATGASALGSGILSPSGSF